MQTNLVGGGSANVLYLDKHYIEQTITTTVLSTIQDNHQRSAHTEFLIFQLLLWKWKVGAKRRARCEGCFLNLTNGIYPNAFDRLPMALDMGNKSEIQQFK